jgi:hypothetical protein
MKLYELTKQYEELLAKVEDGEEFDLEFSIDAIEEALDAKLESCAKLIRSLEAEEEVFKAEAKRLQEKSKSRAASAERLKNYVAACLKGQIYKTKTFNFTYRKSEAVEILDETLLPEEFIRQKVSYEPDKTAIKESIKQGQFVKGATLVSKINLQIK